MSRGRYRDMTMQLAYAAAIIRSFSFEIPAVERTVLWCSLCLFVFVRACVHSSVFMLNAVRASRRRYCDDDDDGDYDDE